MRTFESWETQDLEMTFGLKQSYNSELLSNWLMSVSTLTEYDTQRIEITRNRFFVFSDYWNEDELKMQGISPILDFINYGSEHYTVFSQRPLNATINGIDIGGRVYFMLAQGKQRPIQPYFFIHEYKQERKRDNDPKGQLLAELLAAQHQNQGKFPLYGCFVIGRNWFFVVLHGNEYAVSDAFVASSQDIYKIIAILRQVKTYIEDNISK